LSRMFRGAADAVALLLLLLLLTAATPASPEAGGGAAARRGLQGENQCMSGSGNRVGYAIPNAAAVVPSGLGTVTCATNYATSTVVTVVCSVPGGSFLFGGCSENTCTANSGDRTGYTLATPQATTVSGLGTLACAPNYAGTAVASCASSGSVFQISGCTENVCVAGSGGPYPSFSPHHGWRTGYQVAITQANTVSGLGSLTCAANYAGAAVAACASASGAFQFSGCQCVDECFLREFLDAQRCSRSLTVRTPLPSTGAAAALPACND
jgi:hypothetical protein